ncbi:peptide ABC transporter substrate-binding protein [Holdemania massiliensis]|uniref:peptide ABC transporter substrate-binding protein n=1 Tax=Holdemania massiliensis TaxID=1468449 RepID=UPI0035209DC0
MKKLGIILCAAMLVLVSACSGGNSNSGTTIGTDPQNLKVAMGGQITTLDPGLSTETVNNYILRHTTAGLFRQDEDNNIVNDLCESYSVSDDGLTYTFKIREGVVWSDDQPLTSKDFEYAILRNLTYGAENSWAVYYPSSYLKGAEEILADDTFDPENNTIEGIETPDDQTLILNLKKPCAWFPQMLTNNVWKPLRADFADQHESVWALKPGYPSVGPYLLEECNENEKAIIVKNDKYYDADSVIMPKITFLVMSDTDAQALAFKNSEIDIALNITPTLAENYSNQSEIWNKPDVSNYFLAINSGSTGPETMQNVDVRRALALAIDKEALVTAVGSSEYYKVLNGYIPEGLAGAEGDFRLEEDAKEKYLEYDPEEAKALLAKAGYDESNPLKIVYKYSQTQLHADVAQILQQMWDKIGIDCELTVVESGVFYDQIDNGDFEICRYGYSAGDDPSQYLSLWTTGQQVVPAVDDPAYDKMVDEAGYLVDHAEYMNALHAAERYLVEEMVYVIPLFNYNTPCLLKSNIKNVQMWGLNPYYGGVSVEAVAE